MSSHTSQFSDVLEMIDQLSLEERQSLIDIARKRLIEDERNRIAASVRSARREHGRGKATPTTPEALLREITE